MMSRVEELLQGDPLPTSTDLNDAFWRACAGGQRRVAEYLLGQGRRHQLDSEYAKITPLDAVGSPGTRRDTFASWLRGLNAKSSGT